MADSFDPTQIPIRFRERAEAVRRRGLPPIEGEDRKRFMEQAQNDYLDYAMLADAKVDLTDGILTFTIDLRPKDDSTS